MPTIPQTQTILESYFVEGATPDANAFVEFIGTMFYLYNAMVDLANTLNTEYTAMQALVTATAPSVICQVNTSVSGAPTQLGTATGVASIANYGTPDTGGTYTQINFSTAFANTNFKVVLLGGTIYNGSALTTTGKIVVVTTSPSFLIIIWA